MLIDCGKFQPEQVRGSRNLAHVAGDGDAGSSYVSKLSDRIHVDSSRESDDDDEGIVPRRLDSNLN
jgi:hypothetical protein